MNPIEQFMSGRNNEEMMGNKMTTTCVMGYEDYARFCGAIGALYDIIITNPSCAFQGIRVMESRGTATGMMFA